MTDWFTKFPNDGCMPSQEEEGMSLISNSAPDWVRLPPQLGGDTVKCLGQHIGPCPMHDHQVRHFDLEGSVQVAECSISGFLWYRK